MKIIKLCARIYEEIKSNSEEIHNLEEGITKELLEKYKTKLLHNIETMNGKKVQRGAA